MKKYFYAVLFFLFIFIFNSALFASEPPEGIKIYPSDKGYRVEFSLPQYELISKYGEGGEFYNLLIDGYGVTPEAGLPALPLVSFNLFINDKESFPSFNIKNQTNTDEILSQKIFPQQMPWEKVKPLEERPFVINRNYYNSRGTEQPLIKISEPFIIGGVKGIMVTIYPFSYNPQENHLTVTTTAEIEINLTETPKTSAVKSKDYNSFLDEVFVNYDLSDQKLLGKYLIITDSQFEPGLSAFVTHKENHGCDVDVFTTTVAGTTTTAIKSFIQQRYNDPQTKPEYILLVGDVQHIPAWTGSGEGNPKTDLNYALLEGSDYYADAFIGRFSVTSTTELQNAVSKTIYMESNIATFAKKNVFMASTDNWDITEATHEYVIDSWFDPEGYTNLKLYTHTYNATTQQLINALNDNQVFAIYSGHGGETSWADGPQLSQSQVSGLTNTIYPFVYSFACVTGSYHIAECFGETWLRTSHGGSTFYGSSVNSYWDEDDILERRLIDAMFEDDLTRVTPMMDMAKVYLANHYGSITPTVLRYFEMYNLMGDPSMPTLRQIPPDTTPPNPVTDLAAVNAESNRLQLTWTAPYDSTFNGVTSYDIRYSTAAINNDADFNNADQKVFEGQSDTAGTPKIFQLTELNFGTTYYLAIKAMDMWGNKSAISNLPQGVTLSAPSCLVTPDSMHCLVLPDSSENEVITISNNSTENSTLDYSVELTNNTFPENVKVVVKPVVNTQKNNGKNSKDVVEDIFGLKFKGSGGPDVFGYEWIDSDDANGPQYVWDDISTTGTEVTSWITSGSFDPLDEGTAGPFSIGFNFKYYGTPYSSVYLSTNGFLSFNSISEADYTNDNIPESATPNNIICMYWDDMDGGGATSKVYYQQLPGKFVIQYNNWERYSSGGTYTFQVVLNSNGKIMLYYKTIVGTNNSATVGIENQSGTDGLQIAYDAAYAKNDFAVQIAAEPDWLSAGNTSGTIYSGNSAEISLSMNTDGLELGDYSMDMEITTNDPANPLVIVPVVMVVTDDVPVELSSFNAEAKQSEVTLTWLTATETNNRGFEVERSQKSKVKNQNVFETIAFIEGNGTTTDANGYSFTDKNLKPGNYLYRLKQIDFDGKINYSNWIEAEVLAPDKFSLDQNYPNPFNPSTVISYSLPVESAVTIKVYNILGKEIATLVNETKEVGIHKIEFTSKGEYSSGIYFYTIQAGTFTDTKKFVMIK